MESVGFKEWSIVCDALGRGEQCLLLRKGGLAEGRAGFSFRHREFFLFPTFFHEQTANIRPEILAAPHSADGTSPPNFPSAEHICVRHFAKVEEVVHVRTLAVAQALAPLHILNFDVVRERFCFRSAGLHVAFLRVFALAKPWSVPNEKGFAGCRSWISLPPSPTNISPLTPVLDDSAHARKRALFHRVTGEVESLSR